MAARSTLRRRRSAAHDDRPEPRLQRLLDDLAGRKGIRHAVVAVRRGDGDWGWSGALGEAGPHGAAMHPGTPFHYTSVTKLYTATVVLQLCEEGTVGLDEPMGSYLPETIVAGLHRLEGVDHTTAVTIRHLLAHTSGLPDYFLETPPGRRSYSARLMEADPGFTIIDVVERVRRLTPHFPPQDPTASRQRARYSDTNFQLLGAVIEAVTGGELQEAVEQRILGPLGLADTWFAGRPRPTGTPPTSTIWAGDVALERPRALASLGPDGGLVGTAADALTFLEALVTGDLFEDPGTVGLMQQRWNRFGLPRDRTAIMAPGWPIQYGLGIKRFHVPRLLAPPGTATTLIGHSGASGSWLFHAPRHDLYLAGTVDQTTAAGVPYRLVPRLVRAVTDGTHHGGTVPHERHDGRDR
jgi:D-alanyl-D-alanine carboxypeptidase